MWRPGVCSGTLLCWLAAQQSFVRLFFGGIKPPNHHTSPALWWELSVQVLPPTRVPRVVFILLSIAWGLSTLHLPLDGSNWMRMRLCNSYLSRDLCRDFKLFTSRSMVQIWPRSGGARDLYNSTAAQRPLWAQFVHFRFWSCGRVPFSSLALIGTSAWHTNKEAEDAPKRLNSPPWTPYDWTKGSTHPCAQACPQ